MSGRKSTEVNQLLARGKDARESGLGNYRNNLNFANKVLTSNQEEIREIYDQINDQTLDIKPESRSEFPEESKHLQSQFDNIKKQNVRIDYSDDIKDADDKEKSIDVKLQRADQEQDRIRVSIKKKAHGWYCDQEYEDANKLVRVYQNIADEKNQLVTSMTRKVQKSNQTIVKYETLQKQMEQLITAQKELNEKAAKIVELREKAADAKNYMKNAFEKIDSAVAEKFMMSEYSKLRDEIKQFQQLDDKSVVSKVSALSEKVSIFSGRLDVVYAEYLEKREQTESAIKANKSSLKVSANYYFEPVDYFKNKENAAKIPVIEYLHEYSDKKEMTDAIDAGIKKAEQLFDEENFDAAQKQTEKNTELIHQANQYAALLQEHMIENFYVAKDMTKVMKKMGFETGAYKIDGHIKNGWKISASNPNGENIDFTKVFVDDDGKMNIEIDHKTLGDCPSKWSEITSGFEEMGIYIEKIEMENGTVVMDKRSAKPETNVNIEPEMSTSVK